MLNTNELQKINNIKLSNKDACEIIDLMQKDFDDNISSASHSIKNSLSTLTCIYQYLSSNNPQLNNLELWPLLGESINNLAVFMERTTTYRKIKTYDSDSANLTDVLTAIPDIIDEKFDNSCNYTFDIPTNDTYVKCSNENLVLLFSELAANAAESNIDNGEIFISSKSDNLNTCVTISNSGCIYNIESVPQLFYSEKIDHYGIGYPTAEKIVRMYGGNIEIENIEGRVVTTVCLPNFIS